MTDREQFQSLLTTFERNNATGSLKAANTTLSKILTLLQNQIDVLTGSPQVQAEVAAQLDELLAVNSALQAHAEQAAEMPSHYEAAQAVVGDPAIIEPSAVTDVEDPPASGVVAETTETTETAVAAVAEATEAEAAKPRRARR